MSVKTTMKEWRERYRAWGDVEVTRKRRHIVQKAIGITMVSIVFLAVLGSSLWRLNERIRAQDLAVAAERDYRTQLDVYEADVREREACVTSIETRETYRNLFFGEADTFDAFITVLVEATGGDETRPAVMALRSLIETRRAAIDIGLTSKSLDDCPPEPVRPELPAGLTVEEVQ